MFKKKNIQEVYSWLKTIILTVIIVFVINNVLIINATVPTSSMESTISPKDRIMCNRLAYLIEQPSRGDIVTFIQREDKDKTYIKRLIGLPGDTIEIIEGIVYVNSKVYSEEYLNEKLDYSNYGPYLVPEEHYFFLGDNRTNSKDSRLWINPYIHEDDITGKAIFKYYPEFKLLME